MHRPDITRIAEQSKAKANYLEHMPAGYLILSAVAGVYLGFGITLIFSIGAPFAAAGSPAFKLVMGAAFGIALALVIFAGSELFTGNNMVCAVGALTREISWGTLAWIFAVSQAPQVDLLMKVAATKMNLSVWELMVRGILCNWLVCLAVWTAGRTTNDAAKLVLIFWCLFAFIGSGFEHSIANQSLLGMAMFLPHDAAVSWGGFLWNQVWVILGNIVGGGFFVGGLYWLVNPVGRTLAIEGAPARQTSVLIEKEQT